MREDTIADRCGVSTTELRQFAEFHPDPEPEDILSLADGDTDEDLKELVADWLEDVRSTTPMEDRPGGEPPPSGGFGKNRLVKEEHVF